MIDDETFLSNRVAQLEANEARLLAVARAAKALATSPDWEEIYWGVPEEMSALAEALAAVEDLL